MKKLKIGVIGLGMGAGHIDLYKEHPASDVKALADLDEKRLKEVGEKHRINNLYTDAEKMLKEEKPDIVSIAVPNKFHKDLTIAAMKAGSHVLCEKPMAMNTGEAEEMLETSKKYGKRLMIDFSFRFTPQAYAMKKEVESGILGDIYFARTIWLRRRGLPGFGGWFGTKALSGGGPVIDLGVHRLDLALWLMDYPEPEWIMANTFNPIAKEKAKKENKNFDVEDMGVAMIRFKNGAMLELEASWASNIKNNEEMETRLLGSKAGMRQVNLNEGYSFNAEIYIDHDGRQYDMTLHPPVPEAKSSMYHFVDSIVSGTAHTATAEEGVTIMKILDAIYQSAELEKPVKIT